MDYKWYSLCGAVLIYIYIIFTHKRTTLSLQNTKSICKVNYSSQTIYTYITRDLYLLCYVNICVCVCIKLIQNMYAYIYVIHITQTVEIKCSMVVYWFLVYGAF